MNSAFQFKFTSHGGKFSYTILPIVRQNDALNVLTRAFYPFESVCKGIKLAQNAKAVEELNELVKEAIKDGVSIVAVDNTTNNIIGVSINKIQRLSAPGEVSFFETFKNERCKEKESLLVMQFMMDCDSTVDLFQHFNTEKLMEIMFLAVLPEYGQLGIGYELVKVDLQLLAELHESFKGPDVATALWTSNFSAKIGERLDFQVLSDCFYDKMEYNGVKMSDIIDKQHPCTQVAGKKLEKKKKS